MNAEDVAVYLVDYEQTLLVPLPDGTDRAPLGIDTTLAGRAFAAIAVQEADLESGRRLWLPLLDGAERLGVLGLTLPRVDETLRVRCGWLATLVAELLVARRSTPTPTPSSAAASGWACPPNCSGSCSRP